MTNKIQKIKEEIEKRLSLLWDLIPEGEKILQDNFTKEDANNLGKYTELESLLKFIDSLPEEPANKGLEEAAEVFYNNCNLAKSSWWDEGILHKMSESKETFIAGAEWQKEKDYKMYAHVSLKDIHDAWQELKKNKPDIENYPSVCFQKGADWRENQMKEALQTEYEKGRFDIQQEMMKDAVKDCSVIFLSDNKNWLQIPGANLVKALESFKQGDKVKIIIIKEEQQ